MAASAGEELERRIIAVEGQDAASSWEHHAELGDTARLVAVLLFVLLAAYVLIPWFLDRRSRAEATATGTSEASSAVPPSQSSPSSRSRRGLRIALASLAVVGAAASVTTIIQAGHTGSKSVWEDYVTKTSGG
ncbi:MAG: hypothetical protein JWN62_4193 [Acidimicrobiales bacterium]|nr:hypothetical protein [Acidimicrobiales bacterium]